MKWLKDKYSDQRRSHPVGLRDEICNVYRFPQERLWRFEVFINRDYGTVQCEGSGPTEEEARRKALIKLKAARACMKRMRGR